MSALFGDRERTDRQRSIELTAQLAPGYTVADAVEEIADWAEAGVMDGFIAAPGGSFGSVYCFLDEVVPRLVERGLFRGQYQGATFAEHLQRY